MNQTLNVETLNHIISEMQSVKMLKKIKVTTAFANYLDRILPPLPNYETNKFYAGMCCEYLGVPVEIDDDIDGLYEFVFNKENDNV